MAIKLLRVHLVRLGEHCDSAGREPLQLHALDPSRPRELTEYDTQGMKRVELVITISSENQGAHPNDAAAEKPEDIERRLVSPVQILEHQHCRRHAC